jgi:hypothetical protein
MNNNLSFQAENGLFVKETNGISISFAKFFECEEQDKELSQKSKKILENELKTNWSEK